MRDLYLWAASMFSSRAFPDSLLSWDLSAPTVLPEPGLATQTNADGTTQILQTAGKSGSKPALFPLLDILNHKPRTRITWQAGKDVIGFVGEELLKAGTEVFNNYGPKPNQQCISSLNALFEYWLISVGE